MRVFWPRNRLTPEALGRQGLLIGYLNDRMQVVVVDILETLSSDVAAALLKRIDPDAAVIASRCALEGEKLSVLGFINHCNNENNEEYPINVQNGHVHTKCGQDCLVIEYTVPNTQRMHYLSLGLPIRKSSPQLESIVAHHMPVSGETGSPECDSPATSLNSSETNTAETLLSICGIDCEKNGHLDQDDMQLVSADSDSSDENEPSEFEFVAQKNTMYTRTQIRLGVHTDLGVCIAEINCVRDLQNLLHAQFIKGLDTEEKITEMLKEKSDENDGEFCDFKHDTQKSHRQRVIQVLMLYRKILELVLKLLNFSKLKQFSCIAMQIELRINQLCYLPVQYTRITQDSLRERLWKVADRNTAYIKFYSILLLSILDYMCGVYARSVLLMHINAIEHFLMTRVVEVVFFNLEQGAYWLMSNPAGFKLNTQLASYLGEIIILTISWWRGALATVLGPKLLHMLMLVVANCGCMGGLSLQISVVVDLISLGCIHWFLLYALFARMYRHLLTVFAALFRVFRGRKYNVLRQRVDFGDYDVNQLLLGTLLFTLALFLLPTIFAFYVVFAACRVLEMLVLVFLCSCLAFMNYIPLFPMILRIKEPQRVPGGILFKPCNLPFGPGLSLVSQPVPIKSIFKKYWHTTWSFFWTTFSSSTLLRLLKGHELMIQQVELYASLYSVMPSSMGQEQAFEDKMRHYIAN